jgi:hypothetical protein
VSTTGNRHTGPAKVQPERGCSKHYAASVASVAVNLVASVAVNPVASVAVNPVASVAVNPVASVAVNLVATSR